MKLLFLAFVFTSFLLLGCVNNNGSAASATPSASIAATPIVAASVDASAVASEIDDAISDLNDAAGSIEEVEIGALNDSELEQIT